MTRLNRLSGWRRNLLVSAVAVGVFPTLIACSGSSESDRAPVVVIGVDGMTWGVAEPLMKAGKMPNLQKLVDNGVGGVVRTDLPTFSPILWTSIATGTRAKQHGIEYFSEMGANGQPKPGGQPYTSNSRKVPAIWGLAGENDRSVDSVAWWVSWPAEEVPKSRIVASYAAQAQALMLWKPLVHDEGIPKLTYPDWLQEDIAPILAEGHPSGPLVQQYNQRFGTVPADWQFAFELDRFFRGVYHADQTHQDVFLKLLEDDGPADLNLVYYGSADVSGHYFWRYRQPSKYNYEIPPTHVERLGQHIDKAYEQLDVWFGEIMAKLPADATIMLVSDHGMVASNPDNTQNKQSGGHDGAPPGTMGLSGPMVKHRGLLAPGKRLLGGIYDVAPTLLHMLDLPAGSYMEGAPLRDHMTDAWQLEHPALPAKDYRQGFRAATPPMVPDGNMNQGFIDALNELGYIGDDNQPLAPQAPAGPSGSEELDEDSSETDLNQDPNGTK